MYWPFGKKNREQRAMVLDVMSTMKCRQMGANSASELRVTLEDGQFTIRFHDGNLLTRYPRGAQCERHLRAYYRELFHASSIWSE